MPIEIVEKRMCCEVVDLVPYRGEWGDFVHTEGRKVFFCNHCGQLWSSDAAGFKLRIYPGDIQTYGVS